MDLLDFKAEDLYFDQPLQAEVEALLNEAAEAYADGDSELLLLQAYLRQPDHLSVLVALYRYYYYQHRLQESLMIAERVLSLVGARLELKADWRELRLADLGYAIQHSMTLTRFYLFALKGAGFLELRLRRPAQALERFETVLEVDSSDRIGVGPLRDLARSALHGCSSVEAAA